MREIFFIVNTFPVNNKLEQGSFNFAAAKALGRSCRLNVVHLRSWKPFRSLVSVRKIQGLEVIVFSFPFYPSRAYLFTALQLFFYKRVFYIFLGNIFKNGALIHSVGASFASVIGSHISKVKKIPHIAQCIGTDVNFSLPRIKDYTGVKGIENYVDVFSCNSMALKSSVQQLYPLAVIKSIYRGVNLEYFRSQEYDIAKKDRVVFTYIGGLSLRNLTGRGRDYKGGVTLLNAWERLSDYEGICLNFAGPEVTSELVEEHISHSVSNLNISVFGLLSKERIRELFTSTDVIIIPSWAEGLPNAGMEAIASSCAIIGTNVGGIPELINGNGFLFEPGNTKQLSEVIWSVVSDINNLERMKVESRKLAEKRFDNEQFTKLYLELYEKL